MKLSIADPATCPLSQNKSSKLTIISADTSSSMAWVNGGPDIKRHFLTILFADVVNYSRLIELDDLKTVFRLELLRSDVIKPIVKSHSADLVRNFGGDGLVVSFANPAMAVRCAIDLQKQTEAHEGSRSDNERIRFRIGIAMGSVLRVNGSLHGRPINVAARLQSLAAPGDVWMSETVAKQAHGNAGVGFEALGKLRLKNIAKSVGVHRVIFKHAPNN